MSDRRRNLGPELSVRPLPDPLKTLYKEEEKHTLLDEVSFIRHDGRYPEQVRPPTVQSGIVGRAPGSVYYEVGATKLVCSVYGPRSPSSRATHRTFHTFGNVSCEINFAPFSAPQRCPHQPESEEEEMAMMLLQSVVPAIKRDTFPNAHVDISITVLERDGSILAACISAASIALINAGVSMMDSVVGVGALMITSQGTIVFLMDPDWKEEEIALSGGKKSQFVVAVMPNRGMITQINLTGSIPTSSMNEVLSLSLDGARALYDGAIKPCIESFGQQ